MYKIYMSCTKHLDWSGVIFLQYDLISRFHKLTKYVQIITATLIVKKYLTKITLKYEIMKKFCIMSFMSQDNDCFQHNIGVFQM